MELATAAKELQSPLDLVRQVAADGKLPVVVFCAGGIATPADASLVMQLGAEGVFVGSGIFKSEDPAARAAAIVEATTHFRDADRVAKASEGLGGAMQSLESRKLEDGAAAGQPRLVVGVLALQGDFEAHTKMLQGLGAETREVRVPADLEGLDGLVMPGGESTTMTLGIKREGLGDPLRAFVRDREAGARHVRGDDHARPRAPRLHGHAVPAQRVRPPDPELRGGPGDPRDRRHGARGVHPRAVAGRVRRRASRSSPRSTAIRSPPARTTCS